MSKTATGNFDLATVGNFLNPSYSLAYDGLVNSLADLMLSSYMQVSAICFYVERMDLSIHEKRANLGVLSRLVNQVQAALQSSVFSTAGHICEAISSFKSGENKKAKANLQKLQNGFDYSMLSQEFGKMDGSSLLDVCISSFQSNRNIVLKRRFNQQTPQRISMRKKTVSEISAQNFENSNSLKPLTSILHALKEPTMTAVDLCKAEVDSRNRRRNASPKINTFESVSRFRYQMSSSLGKTSNQGESLQSSINQKLDDSLSQYRNSNAGVLAEAPNEISVRKFFFDEIVSKARRSLQSPSRSHKAISMMRDRGVRQTLDSISSSSKQHQENLYNCERDQNHRTSLKTSIRHSDRLTSKNGANHESSRLPDLDYSPYQDVSVKSKRALFNDSGNRSRKVDSYHLMNETLSTNDKFSGKLHNLNEVQSTFKKLNNTLNEMAERMSHHSVSPEPTKHSNLTISLMEKVSNALKKHKIKDSTADRDNFAFKWISSHILTELR